LNDETEHRLVDLESRLSHQERMAEELSEVVARQALTIDVLTAQIRRLTGRMAEIAEGWSRSPQDDKPPPHY
jgi:SlyX protein